MAFTRLQEYINTGDGVPGTLLIPKLIMPSIIEEQDKALIPRELAAQFYGPSQIAGSSFDVNLKNQNDIDVRETGEGAEVVLDNTGFTNVTFTPKKWGVAVKITREMMEDSQFDLFKINVGTIGKRFAENETNLILGQLDRADNSVAGGAAVTIANITRAMQYLEDADFVCTDYLVGNEVLNDLRNIDTFVEADKAGDNEILRTGFKGVLYGMRVHRFSTNAGANAVATSSYVLDRSKAYGIAIKRDITMENYVMATYDMQGAVFTQRIDVQALRTAAIAKITSS